jgi:hypothetical protein
MPSSLHYRGFCIPQVTVNSWAVVTPVIFESGASGIMIVTPLCPSVLYSSDSYKRNRMRGVPTIT